MGAVPNKKVTRSQRGCRLTSYKLRPLYLSTCPQCRRAKLPHTVCPSCGFYKGRQVLESKL